MDLLTPRSFQDLGEGMRLTSASWTGDMGISLLLRNLSFATAPNSEIFSSVQEMKTCRCACAPHRKRETDCVRPPRDGIVLGG